MIIEREADGVRVTIYDDSQAITINHGINSSMSEEIRLSGAHGRKKAEGLLYALTKALSDLDEHERRVYGRTAA